MHDTFLLNKISYSLEEICKENKITRLERVSLIVNPHSHINEENLKEHLRSHNKDIISNELKIDIQRDDIEELSAIITSIQGEEVEI